MYFMLLGSSELACAEDDVFAGTELVNNGL